MLRESYKTILALFLVIQFQTLSASDYLGCFKDDTEHPGFRYIPSDLDPAHVTPLTCLHACSARYQYAAIAGKLVCLCGNVINRTMKVEDGLCSENCTVSHDNHVCDHVTYYDVYWREQGIVALMLNIDERVELFSRTWFNAMVLGQFGVEFRFKIDGEIISSWSNSSTLSHIFMEKGEHLIQVTARNNFSRQTTVVRTLNVVDRFQNVQFQCPAASVPGNEIVCRGEWRAGSGAVQFNYGDGSSENIHFDIPVNVHNELNQTQPGLPETMNSSLATYVITTALNLQAGEISHWSVVAAKPGRIRVQVLRPYCNATEKISQDLCLSKLNNSNHNLDSTTCNIKETYCLTCWGQCTPSDRAQNTPYYFATPRYNTTSVGYELISEDVVYIPNIGYHIFPSTKILTLQRNDVIAWTSDGGQLRYIKDETQTSLEYPTIGQTGTKLQANGYTKMHFGAHALTAYIRQPLKFELYHTYQKPGVYHIRSSETPTLSITIDCPITPFTINVPRLSQTNSSVFLTTGLHNGTGVTYSWNFGDNSKVTSSKSSTTHVYTYPGQYLITLYASNSVSKFAVNANIEILDPIRGCHIQPIGAIVLGKPIILKWHCAFGSNVTFSVNFDDGHIAEFRSVSDNFIGNNLSHTYTSAGHYEFKIMVSSPLETNVNLTEHVLVEIPVKGLEVRLLDMGHAEVLYIATLSEVSVERVLARGTHVMCTFNFGDEMSVTSTELTVNHTYRKPGSYHVNITCYNHVSSTWRVLNTSIIAEDVSPLQNLTLDIIPTIFGETSKFELVIPYGNLFSCEWDLGDSTTYTTSYPQVNSITHRYREVGTYNVFVTCRNELGKVSITARAEVDEPIRNVSLMNPSSFVPVSQSVAFILKLSKGSRVKYCIDCNGRYLYLGSNVTTATITHAYAIVGQYSVIAHLWNSVSSTTVTALRPLTVQYPVTGIEMFTAQPKRCPSLSVAVCFNLTKNTHPPSNASVLISYGDNSSQILIITDFKSQMCLGNHKYAYSGVYNITTIISNHVSSQNRVLKVKIQNHPLNGVSGSYKNGSVFHKGLGPNNQYFPATKLIKLNIEENRDDVSYDWRVGDESLGDKRVIQKVFPSSGCHNVTIIVKSSSLDEKCFMLVCIEETLDDLNLSVIQPTYFKDLTMFTFSVKNYSIPSCFRLNLGDNTSITFGPSACGSKYQNLSSYTHVYKQRGNYTVTLTRWNHVSKITRSVEVFIWDEACGNVGVNITGGGLKDRPTIVRESGVLVLDAHVSHKCHVAKMVFVHWSVFEWDFGGDARRVASDLREIMIYENSSDYLTNELAIAGSSFGTGVYVVRVTVGFIEIDRDLRNITGSNYTWFEVSRPPLIVRIKGGISRSVPWNEKFVLDGSGSRNLGNIPAKLHFLFLCRLATYPMATNMTSSSPGCFHNGSSVIGNSLVLVVDSGNLYPNQEYVFSLEVMEGTRKSYAEQNVFVLDGPVPSLDLRCIVNCKETINPSKRLLLESKCLNCQTDTRLHYQWSMYICNRTIHSCQELPNFQTKTSTGLQGANIATKENVLEIGATYRVRCRAWRLGSANAGYVDYLLNVNSPPKNGHCSVTPEEGFALETLFNVFCSGWWDKDKPLSYLIEVQNDDYQTYLASGTQSSISIYLPVGSATRNFSLYVIVKVADGRLFSTTILHSVKVFRPTTVNYSQVINDVQRAANSNANDEVFGLVLSLCSIMNNNLNASRHNLTAHSEVRLEVGRILAATNTTDLKHVRGISDAFEALTAKPDEISFELQNEVTETIRRTNPIIESLANTSHDIRTVGTSLHRVLSNVVGAVLLTSINAVTMGTNTSTNTTVTFADMKAQSIQNTFQTVDEVNNVLLQQVLAGDQSTIIKTENYDINLAKRSIKDLIKNDQGNITKFPLEFQDTKRLVENTNFTERNVLGVTVTDLSKTPSNLYDTTAEEINSNILRINVKDSFGQPVDMSDIGLSIFVKIPPWDHKADEFFVIHTRNSFKIHRFNRTTPDAALVLIFSVVDPNLSLRAFLSIGQRPTLKKYSLKTEFTANNLTSGHYTWVVSRDVLRNITESRESHGYFLGVSWSGGMGLGNKNYSLHVAWVKCLLLEEGGEIWTSAGCEVGSLTSLERTHCICRPGQTDRFRRLTRSTEFIRKKTFKIAVGAGVFPTPNKINFHYVFDADISTNPLALIAVSSVFAIYLVLLVFARRRDRKDSQKIGVTALPSNKLSDKYFYEVTIYTGSNYDAGTSAHVSITLKGSEGDLGPRLLHDPMRQCFQRSAIDTFLISSRDLVGDVSYLQIWHDNTGAAPSWFLDKIVVRDLNDKKSYIFYNETWLAVEYREGGIQKLLFPACKDEIIQFKRLFSSTMHSNLKDRHLWFSLLSRPVDSRFTLVQRLSCCLSLLYTTMLANAMFYQEIEARSPESSLIVGPFMFGLREIGVGVMSALIIVPINAGIVWMFRNVEAKPCKKELATRREQTRLWWFYELFFCCFKSRLSPSSLITRRVSDYFYSDGMDVNLEGEDKVSRSQSENSLKNQDVPVEISNDAINLSKKPKESSTSIQLSYWYIYVTWSLVCLTCVVSAFFVVLYGLQFGKVVSYQWLSSMTVSFVQDVLITEPLKVFSIAVVVALIIKKPQNSEHENKDYDRTIVDRHILQNTGEIESKVDDYSDTFHLKPPDRKYLEMARNKRLKELRTGALLRELFLYVLFLFCLSAVTYRNKNPMSFQVHKTMRDLLVERNDATVSFEQISTMNDFLTWINDTFLDALCFSSNKPRLSSDETNTVFGHFYLVGCVRLYQTQDGRVSSSNNTKKPLFMDMNCLNRTVNDQNTSHFTKINNWLNTQTREINIKFNVYNPSLNLFCLAKLTVDILPTNGMETRANFVVTKLFAVGGIIDTLSVVSHVFVFLFFLVFTYRELKQVYLWRKEYFKNIWNILQGILVLLILSCIVVFFLRLAMVEGLLRSLGKNDKRFIHFDTVVFVDNILANLIAFLVFLSWLRVTKFLRFNRRLSFLQDTLGKIAKPLATYSVVFLIVFFAYVHSGYLLFSRELEAFNSLKSTFTSLCSLFMADFDFPSLQNSNRIIGPLFLFSALFFGGFIIINMLIALILESFLVVKTASRANQYELLEYIKKRLRYWFGATGEYTPRRAVLRYLTPGKNTQRHLITSRTTLREKSLCEEGLFPQDSNSSKVQNSSLAGIERSVSGLMMSLECVCAEDWHEEVMLYRLSLKSLGLACYEWLGYVSDLDNLQDLEMDLLRNELYEAVEKYSQELTDRDQNSEKLVSRCEERTFSTFDLNFEEESF